MEKEEVDDIFEKIIVGNKEKVDFPEMKRYGIVARIDSGARSSSAHCDKIWIEKMGGSEFYVAIS